MRIESLLIGSKTLEKFLVSPAVWDAYHQMFVEPTQMVVDYVVRRAHTAGKVAVLDRDEHKEWIETAGKKVGLDDKGVASLWRTFADEERGYLDAEAAKTEWQIPSRR